jgi:hypothetical protein
MAFSTNAIAQNPAKLAINQSSWTPSAVVPNGGSCAAPTATLSPPTPIAYSGNNTGGTNSLDLMTVDACIDPTFFGGASGPEDIYVFTPGPAASLTFSISGTGGFDPYIYLLSTCGNEGTCVAGSDDEGGVSTPTFTYAAFTAGAPYYYYVDSFYAVGATGSVGPYTGTISGTFPVSLTGFSID